MCVLTQVSLLQTCIFFCRTINLDNQKVYEMLTDSGHANIIVTG